MVLLNKSIKNDLGSALKSCKVVSISWLFQVLDAVLNLDQSFFLRCFVMHWKFFVEVEISLFPDKSWFLVVKAYFTVCTNQGITKEFEKA